MSEQTHNEERIEDWVAKEGKAKRQDAGKGNDGKKKIIIGSAIGVVVVIGIILAVVLLKKPKEPETVVAEGIAYLEGLDVMCGPNGIVPDGNGGFLVTDVYGKKIWKTQGNDAVVYAGAATQKDSSGQPLGGYQDGTMEEALFQDPWAIAPFLGGYAVSDTENHAVRLIRDGNVETINGHSDSLEMGDMGVTFDAPTGLATDDKGNLYVADTERGIIYVISEQGKVEVYQDGLVRPMGICWQDGKLYVAETGEHRILQISGTAKTVIAGTGEEGDDDGAAATATFSSPQGVSVTKDGVIYVCDTVNASVRKIKDGNVETILKLDDEKLVTYPLSPVGTCYQDGKLYVCDPFARRVYVIKQ